MKSTGGKAEGLFGSVRLLGQGQQAQQKYTGCCGDGDQLEGPQDDSAGEDQIKRKGAAPQQHEKGEEQGKKRLLSSPGGQKAGKQESKGDQGQVLPDGTDGKEGSEVGCQIRKAAGTCGF